MTISDSEVIHELVEHLRGDVDARADGGRVRVLTPIEYPDGDGVVVLVEAVDAERFIVTDGGAADASLVGRVGTKKADEIGTVVARRYGATFDSRRLRSIVDRRDVADGCWRVAQAAAAIAEAATYERQPARPSEFVDVIEGAFRERNVSFESRHKLEGASGHTHTASLYVPETETVLEPVGGDRAWSVVANVYAEFGDLNKANGYRLVAVVDDRKSDISQDVRSLLSQVADVANWREHDRWIGDVSSARSGR